MSVFYFFLSPLLLTKAQSQNNNCIFGSLNLQPFLSEPPIHCYWPENDWSTYTLEYTACRDDCYCDGIYHMITQTGYCLVLICMGLGDILFIFNKIN